METRDSSTAQAVRGVSTPPIGEAAGQASAVLGHCGRMPFVYMLRCSDGSYYVGSTRNLDDRMTQHSSGSIRLRRVALR
ncbi:GIY-YIG nuclease family protein [Gryllotalpicola kribbensis]|uniref:GIY-YIG nuclease family protein n=1 Tax=Gryllotalpicola kribbensis TaxID=993084 RepID=UPI0031E206D8